MKKLILVVLTIIMPACLIAQVGIGTQNPDPCAILDLTSTNKGLLVPRLNDSSSLTSAPIPGLILYFTSTNTFWYNSSNSWKEVIDGTTGWLLKGNKGTVPGTNFIGTTDAKDLVFKVNNIQTGRFQNSGDYIALGYRAGSVNTGSCNIAIGKNALLANTSAGNNVVIGDSALSTMSFSNSGNPWLANNVAIGTGAMRFTQSTSIFHGVRNTAVGNQTLYYNVKGTENTAVGYRALYSNTNAGYNVAIGKDALYSMSFDNSGFSYSTYNTAIGHSALYSNQPAGTGSGWKNTAVGFRSLYSNITGGENIAVGCSTMMANTIGSNNTAMGNNSLDANIKGTSNIAIGFSSLGSNTNAGSNTAIGNNALGTQSYGGSSGNSWVSANVAVGDMALSSNQPTSETNGNQNTALGFSAMLNNTTGSSNTAIGATAMQNNITGNQNTAIGLNSFKNGANFSNSSALGFESTVNASNQVVLGNEQVTSLVCTGAYAATSTESPNMFVNETGQIMRSTSTGQVKMTSSGGLAISMINAYSSALPKGTIVMASSSDNSFTIASANCEYSLGVLADDCASGSQGWIIVSGIAEVLIKDGSSSSAGNWSGVSDVAGRGYFIAGAPGATQHDREIGHCIKSDVAGTGVLTRVVLHFR